jgi:hypothetical protein
MQETILKKVLIGTGKDFSELFEKNLDIFQKWCIIKMWEPRIKIGGLQSFLTH